MRDFGTWMMARISDTPLFYWYIMYASTGTQIIVLNLMVLRGGQLSFHSTNVRLLRASIAMVFMSKRTTETRLVPTSGVQK